MQTLFSNLKRIPMPYWIAFGLLTAGSIAIGAYKKMTRKDQDAVLGLNINIKG